MTKINRRLKSSNNSHYFKRSLLTEKTIDFQDIDINDMIQYIQGVIANSCRIPRRYMGESPNPNRLL